MTNSQTSPTAAERPRGRIAARIAVFALCLAVVAWTAFSLKEEPAASNDHTSHSPSGDAGTMEMANDGAVQLSAAELTRFGITFASVEDRVLEQSVRSVGLVVPAEDNVAQVTPKFSGFVEQLLVEKTGQVVRKGQALATIYSPELVAAQEELLIARRLAERAGDSVAPGISVGSSSLLQAAKQRMRLWDISDAEIDSILTSGSVRRELTLHSPIGGVVLEKRVIEGQALRQGEVLYTIADLSTVWIEAELRESQLGSVREGTTAEITIGGVPARRFSGRVEFLYPTMETASRTARARIVVANRDGTIKPGMYATVSLTTPGRRALTIPMSAVMHTGQRDIVFVDRGRGRLMPTTIQTGETTDSLTEVIAGLEPGQRVVTSAQFILDSESNLAEVMRAMIGQMGASDMGNMDGMDMSMPGAAPGGDMKGMNMPAPGSGGGR